MLLFPKAGQNPAISASPGRTIEKILPLQYPRISDSEAAIGIKCTGRRHLVVAEEQSGSGCWGVCWKGREAGCPWSLLRPQELGKV